MPARHYYTYIMSSRSRVLYTGMTNSIVRRNAEHKKRDHDSFTAEHRCKRLVWYAIYDHPDAAIDREKEIKGWTRAEKIDLIEEANPRWLDLSEQWGKPIPKYGETDSIFSTSTTVSTQATKHQAQFPAMKTRSRTSHGAQSKKTNVMLSEAPPQSQAAGVALHRRAAKYPPQGASDAKRPTQSQARSQHTQPQTRPPAAPNQEQENPCQPPHRATKVTRQ